MSADSKPGSAARLSVGENVVYRGPDDCLHRAVVAYVYRNGKVKLNWCGPVPHPFFNAPFTADELERVDEC